MSKDVQIVTHPIVSLHVTYALTKSSRTKCRTAKEDKNAMNTPGIKYLAEKSFDIPMETIPENSVKNIVMTNRIIQANICSRPIASIFETDSLMEVT